MRPPGHSGKAKKGHLCFDAIYETGRTTKDETFQTSLFKETSDVLTSSTTMSMICSYVQIPATQDTGKQTRKVHLVLDWT